jgi:hypothetical protein
MSKAIDLGKRLSDLMSEPSKGPDEPHYPDLYISDVDDPRLADIPDKGECTIRYRVCSRTHREEKNGGGNGKKHSCSLRLEVMSISPPEGKEYKKKNGNGYGDDARKSFSEYFKNK